MAAVMEIDEIQSVRDTLAEKWAPWARRQTLPQGWKPETIEYVMMRFGIAVPKAEGAPSPEFNPEAERIEGIIVSMPPKLKRFIVVEFTVRTADGERLTKEDKARLTHTSKAAYYNELRSALWWLHSARV